MDDIEAIARRHGLAIIEDCCQAHGASVGGRAVGTFGTACFSFYPTKNMTTGEGGMVTTDDADIAAQARDAAQSRPERALSARADRVQLAHDGPGRGRSDWRSSIAWKKAMPAGAANARPA